MTLQELIKLRDELSLYLRSAAPDDVGRILILVGPEGDVVVGRNVTPESLKNICTFLLDNEPAASTVIRTN